MHLEPSFASRTPPWPFGASDGSVGEPPDPALRLADVVFDPIVPEADRHLDLTDASPALETGATVPLAAPTAAARTAPRKWSAAVVGSVAFHAAVALFFVGLGAQQVLIAGSEDAGVVIEGNASDDQLAEGELSTDQATNVTLIEMMTASAVPIETEAVAVEEPVPTLQSVRPDTVAETLPPERVEPVRSEPVRSVAADRPEPLPEASAVQAAPATPARPAEPVAPERPTEVAAAAEPAPTVAAQSSPEVLAVDRAEPATDDNVVPPAQPLAAEPVEPVVAAEIEEPAEPVEPSSETVTPAAAAAPVEPGRSEPEAAEALQPETAERLEPDTPPVAADAPVLPEAAPVPEAVAAAEPPATVAEEPGPRGETEPAEPPVGKARQKAETKPVETKTRKKEVAEAAGKQTKKAGSSGRNRTDSKRGAADGAADGSTSATGKGGKTSSSGNAAVSNYPGKVASKLRRTLRYPPAARKDRLRGEVQVAFTVSSAGGVAAVRVARSSGFSVLDQAAIEAVRRASPFPPIPADAGRSSWSFTVPLAFSR